MKKNKGFTLMETIVALGITAVALGFFVAVFAPAIIGIRRGHSVQEAKSLANALTAELNTSATVGETHFEKAFDWVSGVEKESGTFPSGTGLIIGFKYRADAGETPSEGVYPAYQGGDFIEAENSDIQPMTIKSRVALLTTIVSDVVSPAPLDSVEGSVFAISLTQFVKSNDELELDSSGSIGQLKDGDLNSVDYDNFTDGSMLVQADFYLLESNAPSYLESIASGNQELPAQPIYSTRIGVSR